MKLASLAAAPFLLAQISALNLGLKESPTLPLGHSGETESKKVKTFSSEAPSLIKKGSGAQQIESWHPLDEDEGFLQEAKKLLSDF